MTRRQAIRSALLAASAATAAPHVIAQGLSDITTKAIRAGAFPFVLPPLPYGFDALEPHIDARTMEVHHGKGADSWDTRWRVGESGIYHGAIHAAQVTDLNKAIGRDLDFYGAWEAKVITGVEKRTGARDRWLEHMMRDLNAVPEKIREAVRRNGGGHYNHSLFWQMMKKGGGGGPKGELATALEKHFGNFDQFKSELTKAALGHFGSGWAWLTLDGQRLKMETTANEDSPLSAGREVLLGIDLWEHAYYLQYQNRRADYVAAWFNVINWDFVADRYAKLKA